MFPTLLHGSCPIISKRRVIVAWEPPWTAEVRIFVAFCWRFPYLLRLTSRIVLVYGPDFASCFVSYPWESADHLDRMLYSHWRRCSVAVEVCPSDACWG